MEELFQELLTELRGLRQDLRESEMRIMLISFVAEPCLESGLKRHVNHVRASLGRIYDQARMSGNQGIVDALDHAPVSLLPDEKTK